MATYRKAAVAVLGALLQILGYLATATDAGILPDSWRPWVAVIVSLATALGVYQVPNATALAPKHSADENGSLA